MTLLDKIRGNGFLEIPGEFVLIDYISQNLILIHEYEAEVAQEGLLLTFFLILSDLVLWDRQHLLGATKSDSLKVLEVGNLLLEEGALLDISLEDSLIICEEV